MSVAEWSTYGGGASGRHVGPSFSPPPQYTGKSPAGGQGMLTLSNPGQPAPGTPQMASRGINTTVQHGMTQARDVIADVSNNVTNAVNSNKRVQTMRTDPYVAATIMTSFLAFMWAIGLLALGTVYYRKYGRLPTEDLLNVTPDGLMIALQAERGRQGFTYGVFPPLIIAFLLKLTMLAFLLHSQGKFKNWRLWGWIEQWRKDHLHDRSVRHRRKAVQAKERGVWHGQEAYRAGDQRTDEERKLDDLEKGEADEDAGGPGHVGGQVYPMQTTAGVPGRKPVGGGPVTPVISPMSAQAAMMNGALQGGAGAAAAAKAERAQKIPPNF